MSTASSIRGGISILVLAAAGAVMAQDFPLRPITFIVPFPRGHRARRTAHRNPEPD